MPMNAKPPDLAALYLRYRDRMHRTAAGTLRGAGLASKAEVEDVVQEAITSILASPPKYHVQNWESFLVTAVKRKALDRIKSAHVRHSGPQFMDSDHDQTTGTDLADDVANDLDRRAQAAAVRASLIVLDERRRKAVWETVALERPRSEVAAELGVTPSRVSQMCAEAFKHLREEMEKPEGGNDE